MNKPKSIYKKGDTVYCIPTERDETISSEPIWNGRTYMYAFIGQEMRCGEDYLKKAKSNMKSKAAIEARLAEHMKDDRLYYPAADIFTNSPLAMIQLTMETEIHLLEWILDKPRTNFAELREQAKKNKRK